MGFGHLNIIQELSRQFLLLGLCFLEAERWKNSRGKARHEERGKNFSGGAKALVIKGGLIKKKILKFRLTPSDFMGKSVSDC